MFQVGRYPAAGIDDAVPGHLLRRRANGPAHADGREPLVDHLREHAVRDDTPARHLQEDRPDALERRDFLFATSPTARASSHPGSVDALRPEDEHPWEPSEASSLDDDDPDDDPDDAPDDDPDDDGAGPAFAQESSTSMVADGISESPGTTARTST